MKPSLAIEQCYQNIRAVLLYYEIPQPAVIAKLCDRVMFAPSRLLEDRVDWLTTLQLFERWDFVQNHGATAMRGWRECVPCSSTQIIVHKDAIEIDADRFNPDYGAGPAFFHLFECITPGKTDPFAIRRGLRKRGIEVPDIRQA